MSEETCAAIFGVMKYLAICCTVAGVCFLVYEGKDGWGWLIFIGVLLCGTTIQTSKTLAAQKD